MSSFETQSLYSLCKEPVNLIFSKHRVPPLLGPFACNQACHQLHICRSDKPKVDHSEFTSLRMLASLAGVALPEKACALHAHASRAGIIAVRRPFMRQKTARCVIMRADASVRTESAQILLGKVKLLHACDAACDAACECPTPNARRSTVPCSALSKHRKPLK